MSTDIEQEHDKYVKKYLITFVIHGIQRMSILIQKKNIITDINSYGLDNENDNYNINNYIIISHMHLNNRNAFNISFQFCVLYVIHR